jgi:hypothetical protein
MKFELISDNKYFTESQVKYVMKLEELGFKFTKKSRDFCLDSSQKVYGNFLTIKALKEFEKEHGGIYIEGDTIILNATLY